jgi:hypothetical protein
MIPEPVVDKIATGIYVVRDDLVSGGTKRCFLDQLICGKQEVVYASPAYGGAQIAIAHAAKELGSLATIFVAKRAVPHPRTLEAKAAGAKIVQVSNGYLSNVQSKAKAYSESTGSTLLPFGLETPIAFDAIAARARIVANLIGEIDEVWSVGGSGVLTRGLQRGLNAKRYFVVQVGRELKPQEAGRARIIPAKIPFEKDARKPPPFPSCSNYDAKGWEPFVLQGKGKRLFWNVAK